MFGTEGPPLDPSPDQARQWVEEELRKGVYRDEPGLVQRVLDWLRDHLHFSGHGLALGAPPWLLYAATLGLGVILAVVVLRTVRRDARRTDRRSGASGVLGGDRRTAAELRAAAAAGLTEGRWGDAVVAAMRAMAAAAVERSVLEESPGRTATELAAALGTHFPAQRTDLRLAAHDFDAVRYGHLGADEAAARRVVATDAAVAAARPFFADPASSTIAGGP